MKGTIAKHNKNIKNKSSKIKVDPSTAFTAETAGNAYNAFKCNQVPISNNNQKQAQDDPHNKHKQGKPVASAR